MADPKMEWIEPGYAIWTFSTADRSEQERHFRHWCGWFGYGEDEKPERVDGKRWWIRSSLN